MNTLIFIDTNIMLDFYRYPQGTAVLSILKHIDKHHDKIITSNQVEMEFKKNRQKVILDSIKEMKKPNWETLKIPIILSEAQPGAAIEKSKKSIDSQLKKLKGRIEKILKDPAKNDQVYQTMQRLFKSTTELNLTRENDAKLVVREFARKRFELGYPPRKPGDTSIGDPVNWEWIIHCAQHSNSNVIVVSRDSDYGHTYGDESFINDWLAQEFKDRVSNKRKVTLTNRLTNAFKEISIAVSQKEVEDESHLIEETSSSSFSIIPPASFSNFDEIAKAVIALQENFRSSVSPLRKQYRETAIKLVTQADSINKLENK